MEKPRILVVEDQFIVAQDLAASLTALGYEVVDTADNGPAAVARAGELLPDLIIMDIVLKGEMDGIEAAGLIARRHRIPVIFLTAFADRVLLERAKITEPYAYLIKPYSNKELHSAIEVGLYKARMERELRGSRQRFKETTDLLPAGIVETDGTGQVTFINPAGLSILVLSGDDIEKGVHLGRHLQDRSPGRPGADSCVLQALQGRRGGPSELRLQHPDGSERWIVADSGPMRSGDRVVGARLSITDITELHRLQRRLQHARRMETIATLAGGIAHEFNNALTTIITGIELLQMDDAAAGPAGRYLTDMKASADRMARHIRQLLAFAQAGKHHVVVTRLDRFVGAALPLLTSDLAAGIQVHSDFQDPGPAVEIDETQFQMVLSAVLANAREAIGERGTVTVRTGESVFPREGGTPGGLPPGRYASLTVADNGSGMDEAVRRRIFEPFFTTKFHGRGLGMASVYGVVRNHCGWVGVESQPGRGTVVTIHLPAAGEIECHDPSLEASDCSR